MKKHMIAAALAATGLTGNAIAETHITETVGPIEDSHMIEYDGTNIPSHVLTVDAGHGRGTPVGLDLAHLTFTKGIVGLVTVGPDKFTLFSGCEDNGQGIRDIFDLKAREQSDKTRTSPISAANLRLAGQAYQNQIRLLCGATPQ